MIKMRWDVTGRRGSNGGEGRGGKKVIKKEIWGGTAKNNGHLRGQMKTLYSKSFLKDIHAWKKSKWSHQITEETIS